jgi:hypothetical protein
VGSNPVTRSRKIHIRLCIIKNMYLIYFIILSFCFGVYVYLLNPVYGGNETIALYSISLVVATYPWASLILIYFSVKNLLQLLGVLEVRDEQTPRKRIPIKIYLAIILFLAISAVISVYLFHQSWYLLQHGVSGEMLLRFLFPFVKAW